MSRHSAGTAGHQNPVDELSAVFGMAAGAVTGCIKGLIAGLRWRCRSAANYRRLSGVPDHILKDIGVGRSEVRYLARYGREI